MLCAIPCIHICCGKKHEDHDEFDQVHGAGRDENQQLLNQDDGESMSDVEQMLKLHCPKAESHDNLGEIFIHQVIETIEFVLGCISNTASYLRLWALSLAHGQLGEVFLSLIFTVAGMWTPGSFGTGKAIVFFFIMGFPFMTVVVAVLLMMDALEVFLHTMRLHWVEFMGKFYQGQGTQYRPFSFKEVFSKERSRVDNK
jgi:V-type H+-transporting ATPase subunit a|mmetsp:Transcript_29663/g.39441  ORF Transcript_29663/g.39441 Transcript_29663/m.39441 type:complete len:199 (+) Transcript_29663:2020-2616(+)|eukprot:Macronucleus_4160.p1 GENE.Macronucleus_4160~~Macronucleus_4160.p1  ORF type:complete len:199 (+),score=65.57 Macronucleus_4160:1-597(+)